MNSILPLAIGIAFIGTASAQTQLGASTYLVDNNGPVEGVYVGYSTQAAGAVLTASAWTDANGLAAATLDLPAGTVQGMLQASYLNCDSVETLVEMPYSVNAIGGIVPVVMTGLYCGGDTTSGGGCNPVLDGGLTFVGAYQFFVADAPEDADIWWSLNGAVNNVMGSESPAFYFEEETVNVVCVEMMSASCGNWTDCVTIDLTTGNGGGGDSECAIAFDFGQTQSPAGGPVAGSVDVWLTEGTDADSYYWDFGDEGTSQEMAPTHSYAGNGPYLLCVTAIWNDSLPCTAQYCDTLSVDDSGMIGFNAGFTISVYADQSAVNVAEIAEPTHVALFPNPASSGRIQWSAPAGTEVHGIAVYNLLGALLHSEDGLRASQGVVDASSWPAGHYLIQFNSNHGGLVESLRIQ